MDEDSDVRRAPLGGTRGVSYDLWLTLIRDRDSDALWTERLRRLRAALDLSEAEVRDALSSAHAEHRAEWDAGRALPFADLVGEVVRASGRDARDAALRGLVQDALDGPTLDDGVELLDGVRPTLETLAEAGIALGLVCDTGFTSGDALRGVLDGLGLLPLFSTLVFSEELGVPKPATAPFSALLDGLGLPAQEVVHVGDLRRKDAAGARAAGLATVRYRGARDDADEDADLPDADVVIDRHGELLGLLGLATAADG